ncbi:malonate transporter subunit MadL [Gilliamella sp. wkB108]|uniref:malonate transporter subunit MadL n=1 Tax=Gilliamella sp. wkB108 TaxID=3120256 RepID=UPI00080DF7C0|nr:malonate transporter subunit MadL [Gilliamella apicola]OCG24264.1 malonate transporter subunit MadL [Gilliamella apicola]
MIIYGLALLSFCMFVGVLLGTILGHLLGIPADIGGVGFAMILLMACNEYFRKKGWMKPATISGITFWSSMYIPIVVAMSAIQNVYAAVSGGLMAFTAGTLGCALLWPLIRVITKLATVNENWEAELAESNKSK